MVARAGRHVGLPYIIREIRIYVSGTFMTEMSTNEITSGVDAFTAEVIRSTVVAITDEMKTNLMRTAYNMII